ncbi:septal ring lytic transglycosylase RlpA family protein [Hymenobacter sp. UV11]|uniref:septal ring lytic transglycosylase RlpA family protein n=1 Tax=Hymenobacter sp. UV11 TaxID=1849735 RepID=UPI0010E75040|nr:septal ring lytic transglycosylase RlpA family protein [Hymenobacter sp. UV11]TDN36627.1 hypothetical protein A8B98_08025 [Hymenobacter sp. UV11]
MLPTIIPAAREGYSTVLRGRASWYGKQFQGKKTTSGERFNRFKYTCAHKTLPFGTRLRVTNLTSGATVVVRVTDRGPFRHQRIIDLAEVAARPLGIVESGAATVVAEVVDATTPLGVAETPDNLAVLREGDPNPAAPFTAYLLPDADTAPTLAATDSQPATPAAAPAAPRYEVQAGTFATPEAARTVLARILTIDQALPADVVAVTVGGRQVNQVVVGQLANWLAAETVRRNLQLWGITGLVRTVPAHEADASSLARSATTPDGMASLRR